jgi:hypothetical protein
MLHEESNVYGKAAPFKEELMQPTSLKKIKKMMPREYMLH